MCILGRKMTRYFVVIPRATKAVVITPKYRDGIAHRQPREEHSPEVHYGVITSGNELMKNVVKRHRLGRELSAKCVEMEAAGLMTDFPCIVVRGICDYAHSHKNDIWQEYAPVTVAGFTKELMATVEPAEVTTAKKILVSGSGNAHLEDAYLLSDETFMASSVAQQWFGKSLRQWALCGTCSWFASSPCCSRLCGFGYQACAVVFA